MKIRLMGLPDQVDTAIARIATVLDVVEVSEPYKNRGDSQLVRRYMEVQLIQPSTVTVRRTTPPTTALPGAARELEA